TPRHTGACARRRRSGPTASRSMHRLACPDAAAARTDRGRRQKEGESAMRSIAFAAALSLLPASALAAGAVTGEYVEARTAEVFAGGCIMSSEAETIGRQAILAWRIDEGTYQGQ